MNLNKLLCVLMLSLFLGALAPISALGSSQTPRVLVLIIDRLELSEINARNTPNLNRLARENAVGLISLQKSFAYLNVPSAFYTTVGAGAVACGIEPARAAIYPTLPLRAARIAELNRNRNSRASIGGLGQALHDAGLKTAAVGKSTPGAHATDFLNAVMDKNGLVDDLALIDDKDAGPAKFDTLVREALAKNNLVAADLNEMDRLKKLAPPIQKRRRLAIVKRADEQAGLLAGMLNENDMLIIMMPFSRAQMKYGLSAHLIAKGEPLSPVMIRGGGLHGLLKSGTTRLAGVIGAADLMPTILRHLGISTEIKYTARPAYAVPTQEDKTDMLGRLSSRAFRHDAFMLPVLLGFVVFGLGVLTVALIAALWRRQNKDSRPLRCALTAAFLFPLAINIAAFFDLKSLALTGAFIALLVSAAIPLVFLIKHKLLPVILVLAASCLLLIVDTFTGQAIAANSLLGNSLMAGGRYYGLGNQFLGFLFIDIVLLFVLLGSIQPRLTPKPLFKLAAAGVFALLLVTVGSARLGANYGGLITLSASLPLVYAKLFSDKKLTKRHMFLFLIVALAIIVAFTVYDMLQKADEQSHAASLFKRDIPFAVSLFVSKVMRNVEETILVLYRWGGFLVLAILSGLLFTARRRLSAVFDAFPLFRRALPGIALAAAVAYLYNDTGVEPLAIISLYTLAAFLYLIFAVDN